MTSKMNILHVIAVTAVFSSTSGMKFPPSQMADVDLQQLLPITFNYFKNRACPDQAEAILKFGECVTSMAAGGIPSLCRGLQDRLPQCAKPLLTSMNSCDDVGAKDFILGFNAFSQSAQLACANRKLLEEQVNCISETYKAYSIKCGSTAAAQVLVENDSRFFSPETCSSLENDAKCFLKELVVCGPKTVNVVRNMFDIFRNSTCKATDATKATRAPTSLAPSLNNSSVLSLTLAHVIFSLLLIYF